MTDLKQLEHLLELAQKAKHLRCAAEFGPEYDCGAPDCDCAHAWTEFDHASRNSIPALSRLLADFKARTEALEEAIKWIENAPADTWGIGSSGGGMTHWYLRDELLANLRSQLSIPHESTGEG